MIELKNRFLHIRNGKLDIEAEKLDMSGLSKPTMVTMKFDAMVAGAGLWGCTAL